MLPHSFTFCPCQSLFVLREYVSPVVKVDSDMIEFVCDSLFLFSPKVACYSGWNCFINMKETNLKHFQYCKEEHLFFRGGCAGLWGPRANTHYSDMPASVGSWCSAFPGSLRWGVIPEEEGVPSVISGEIPICHFISFFLFPGPGICRIYCTHVHWDLPHSAVLLSTPQTPFLEQKTL